MPWNKQAIVKKIVTALGRELENYANAARAARAEATHEQSRAENKYDTRGLEASYLARGQSRQVAEIEQAIAALEKLPLPAFGAGTSIDLGALVELEIRGQTNCYFLAPRAGGTEVRHGSKEILVITPQSPLGQQIVGRKLGDVFRIEIAGRKDEYRIQSVA